MLSFYLTQMPKRRDILAETVNFLFDVMLEAIFHHTQVKSDGERCPLNVNQLFAACFRSMIQH